MTSRATASRGKGGLFAAFALLPILVLGACDSGVSEEVRNTPAFGLGRSHGCSTASSMRPDRPSKGYRDERLWASDPAYQAGWREGYRVCGG